MTLGYICPGLFIYKLYYVTHPSFGDHLDLFYISLYDYMLQVEYFFVDEQHTVLKLLVMHHVRDICKLYTTTCVVFARLNLLIYTVQRSMHRHMKDKTGSKLYGAYSLYTVG